MKYFLLSILTFYAFLSGAQNVDLNFQSLTASKSKMPFWLWANQLGRVKPNEDSNKRLSLSLYDQWTSGDDWTFSYHTTLDGTYTDKTKLSVIELAAKAQWKFLYINAGRFAEEELYEGLSSSNGDLFLTRNARPHSRVRAGLSQYVPVFSDWLSVKGHFEEGILDDNRYVKDTHLHFKQLFLKFGKSSGLQVEMGLNHFVMWGGTSLKYGKLPGFSDYLKYITGSAGGGNALDTDKANVLGNQYGTYQLIFSKKWEKWSTKLYVSHPFDDKSGMELTNHKDNLVGFYISKDEGFPLLKSFLVEYIHTRNQSGRIHLAWSEEKQRNRGRGRDNYLNNSVYASGATYKNMVMGTPLFSPVTLVNGQSRGISNNLVSGFHLGAKGYFNPQLQWTGKFTITDNGGTLSKRFSARRQVAMLAQVNWQLNKLPLEISLAGALDNGAMWDDGKETTRVGAQFSVAWRIN